MIIKKLNKEVQFFNFLPFNRLMPTSVHAHSVGVNLRLLAVFLFAGNKALLQVLYAYYLLCIFSVASVTNLNGTMPGRVTLCYSFMLLLCCLLSYLDSLFGPFGLGCWDCSSSSALVILLCIILHKTNTLGPCLLLRLLLRLLKFLKTLL